MKNVYLVQPSAMLNNSIYLPYSIGCIAAYSFTKSDIKNSYNLCDLIFMTSPIEDVIRKIQDPYIVGFSCYMWNIDYNLSLAKAIKEKWPDSIIAFGGPQIPDDFSVLKEYAFIDILMHGEGEKIFYELLKSLDENISLNYVNNISFRNINGLVRTPSHLNTSLDDYPSPYTTGIFDKIINSPEYNGIQFDTVLETTRGCPYNKCVFCYWSGIESNLRQFPEERVKGDLKWMAKNKICFCICADSNFGILERDQNIATYITELKKEYGYPQKFETTATKNKSDLTFRINSNLEAANLNRGISLAIQSFSPDVLKIIGRKNISDEKFKNELTRYRMAGMYTYTDLILGLPGETLDSFCKGLFKVIESGQHDSINVNRCELLPNSKMYEKDFISKYKIKTIRSKLCQNHSRVSEDALSSSRSELVVETNTMSVSDWRTALRISICVQSFHCIGLLKFVAIYLRKAKNISYYQFYMNLYEWIERDSTFIKQTLFTVCESIDRFLEGKDNLHFSDKRFGDIYWDFQEGLFLCCVAELDAFYSEISDYLKRYFDDELLFEDLFRYQKERIELPGATTKAIETEYDWYDYFEHIFDDSIKEPKKKQSILEIAASETDNWIDYARIAAWYGRRNGKMLNKITNR